jgi:hypothetical protein
MKVQIHILSEAPSGKDDERRVESRGLDCSTKNVRERKVHGVTPCFIDGACRVSHRHNSKMPLPTLCVWLRNPLRPVFCFWSAERRYGLEECHGEGQIGSGEICGGMQAISDGTCCCNTSENIPSPNSQTVVYNADRHIVMLLGLSSLDDPHRPMETSTASNPV